VICEHVWQMQAEHSERFVEAFADALGGAGMLCLETTGQDGGSVLFASSY